MKEIKFRTLRADEIEVRVGRATKEKVSLLLYKTSQTDVALLNETLGAENWTNQPKIIDNNLWMGIGIWDEDKNDYVWKWSVGTESNMEAEKGEDSDAIKRAGFRWGLGLELYSAPSIWIPADKCNIVEKNGKWVTYDHFEVTNISYDENRKINGLAIINTSLKGDDKTVFSFLTKSLAKKLTKDSEARIKKIKEVIKNARKES